MQVSQNTVVQIHYTLKNENGEVIDSSRDGDPLPYLHGAGNILPKLESALEGRAAGDQVNVHLTPEDGYGEHRPELVQQIPREKFPVDDIQPGMRFSTETEQGSQILTVTGVEGENVTIDANHPLAGETLNFDVEVVDLREATDTEMQHGHVHDGSEEEQE